MGSTWHKCTVAGRCAWPQLWQALLGLCGRGCTLRVHIRAQGIACAQDLERWAANLLPSRQFGYVIVTTSSGIMDHEEARRKKVGGKVLGFFY